MRQVTLTEGGNINLFFETVLAPFDGKFARPEAIRLIYGENDENTEWYELYANADTQGEPYAVLEASTVTSELIQFHIARAYFATAWIALAGEVAGPILIDSVLRVVGPDDARRELGVVNFEALPKEIPPKALEAAAILANALRECNDVNSLAELYLKAEALASEKPHDRKLSYPDFGHFLGMQAMGHSGGLDWRGIPTCDVGIVRPGEALNIGRTEATVAIPQLGPICL